MDFNFKTERAEIPEPQLAAMIDVFSILIIFLIAGTVIGASSIDLPEGVLPPLSQSKESLVSAPQLTITDKSITLGFSTQAYPPEIFLPSGTVDPRLQQFKTEITEYLKSVEGKPDSKIINLVADQKLTYDKIFDVIKATREAGFQSIMFVSTASGAP